MENPSSPRTIHVVDLILLLSVLGVIWGRFLLGRSILYTGDTFGFYANRFTLFTALHHGYFPAWESAALSGNPFCASPQSNCFYPLSLWYGLPDFFSAYHTALVSHLALAGVGAYVWLRGRGHTRLAGLVAACVFASSGPTVSMVNRLDKLQSLCWWPWVLWGLERLMWRRRGGFAVLVGSLSLSLLAGGLEAWALIVASLPVWGLFVLAPEMAHGVEEGGADGVEDGRAARGPGGVRATATRGWLRMLALLAAGMVVCLLVTAPQWLSLLELLRASDRSSGMSYQDAVELSMHPADLFSVVLPNLFYNPATEGFHAWPGAHPENRFFLGLYLGWLPILALLAALARGLKRDSEGRVVRACLLLIGIGLLMALGDRNPLYRPLFEWLPPLRSIRYPEKFLSLAGFFTLPLIAVGVDRWKASARGFWLPALVGGSGLLALTVLPGGVARVGAGVLAWSIGATRAAWEGKLVSLQPALFQQALLLLVAGAVGSLAARGLLSRALARPLILALVALDLWNATWVLNPPTDSTPFRTTPTVAAALLAEVPEARVHILPLYSLKPLSPGVGLSPPQYYQWLWQMLYPPMGQLAGVQYADGARSIRLNHVSRFFGTFMGAPVARQLELASMAGIEGVVALSGAEQTHELEGRPEVHRMARADQLGIEAWRIDTALPRAYVVNHAVRFQSADLAMDGMLAGSYSPRAAVGLVDTGNLPGSLAGGLSGGLTDSPARSLEGAFPGTGTRAVASMRVEAGGGHRVLEAVDAGAGGFLVLTEAWYPGWQARVDGILTPVLEANGYQQALRLGAGVHRVELEFTPTGRPLALLLSLIGLAVLALSVRRPWGAKVW